VVTRELRARSEHTGSSGKIATNDELDMLELAFTAEYVRDAHAALFEYITKCWERHTAAKYITRLHEPNTRTSRTVSPQTSPNGKPTILLDSTSSRRPESGFRTLKE
jgi:hypothetical protein